MTARTDWLSPESEYDVPDKADIFAFRAHLLTVHMQAPGAYCTAWGPESTAWGPEWLGPDAAVFGPGIGLRERA